MEVVTGSLTAATEVAEGDGRSICETDKGTFVIQIDFYILGYILKGGETQLSKLHILTKFDKNPTPRKFNNFTIMSNFVKMCNFES